LNDATENDLAALLAAYDEELRGGPPAPAPTPDGVPPEVRAEWERAQACLRLLEDAWPRGQDAPTYPGSGAPTGPLAVPGKLGRFEVRSEVGRGGFGTVYLARDPRLGRDVALKVPRAGVRTVLDQEARAAAALDHPNVVQVYEAGEVDGIAYIAMAYCPGLTLAEWLAQQRQPVPVAQAAELVATLAEAVQYAHQRGVVHRDLKPANVLLGNREQGTGNREAKEASPSRFPDPCSLFPKITDFGLAKQLDAGAPPTQTGTILGTPCYMAPEQTGARGERTGPATDVYALGAVFYELLTGRPPFLGETALDTLQQVRGQDPVPPRQLRPGVPRDLETICLKCLEKPQRSRYASAAALADDLRRFLSSQPITARPVGAVGRAAKWCRRRPAVAALLAALSLVTVAAVVGLTALWLQTAAALMDAEEARKAEGRALADAVAARNAEATERAKAEANLYSQQLLLARQQIENQRFADADKTLQACDPKRRDRQWRLLQRILHARLWQHDEESPLALAFDGTGATLAVAGQRGLAVLEVNAGLEKTFYPGLLVDVVVPGKDRAVVRGHWGARDPKMPIQFGVTICDLSTGARLGGFPIMPQMFSTHLSPRGDLVAVLEGRPDVHLHWINAEDGKELRDSGTVGSEMTAAFSGDGTRFAILHSGAQATTVWDVTARKELRRISFKHDFGDPAALQPFIALSRDGSRVAVVFEVGKVGQSHGHVKVFDTTTGQPVLALDVPEARVTAVALCPTGGRLATATDDRRLVLWDLATGKELVTYRTGSQQVQRLAFSADGNRLAAADLQTVVLWDSSPLGE
jgi:hypothetical protein